MKTRDKKHDFALPAPPLAASSHQDCGYFAWRGTCRELLMPSIAKGAP